MTDTQLFKLKPSDFKYLWEECKHCYYKSVRDGEVQPSKPFPNMFNIMQGMLQRNVQGTNTEDLIPELPSGKFILEERFVTSSPMPSGKSYLKGKFDLLAKFEDGTYGIVDLKMTNVKDDSLDKFSRQLHAYKYAFENPAEDEPALQISRLGLLLVPPTDIKPHEGNVYYKVKPVWREIKIDMDSFLDFIEEVEKVLGGDIPEPNKDCKWCVYRYDL